MLREGDKIEVEYKKKLQMPDGKDFFMVEDTHGHKFLLPFVEKWESAFLSHRNFMCIVDKINCSGKIFLEPLHPLYQIGQFYPFQFKGQTSICNPLGETRYFVHFEDKYQNKSTILSTFPFPHSINEIVQAKIIGIKRSLIYITVEIQNHTNLIEGREYEFLLKEEKENISGKKLLIFEDLFGGKHSADASIYGHYQLQIGQSYFCRIKKFTEEGEFKIEPKNPYYTIGNLYHFEFLEGRIEKDIMEKDAEVIVVKDVFEKEASIVLFPEDYLTKNPLTQLPARVVRINNARLYLEAQE